MSTGFSGNLGYVIPDNWSFDQFYETSFTSRPTFDIDKVGVSGKDGGCRSFNPTVDDINELQEAREKYVNKCLQGLNYLDKTAGIELDFENGGQYNLGIVNVNGLAIEGKLKVSTAIVRKLNPNCGFVLMDKLEQMDPDTLQDFGAWLEREGLQVIATRVSTGDECSVIIEDGMVKSEEAAAKPAWKAGTF